jgi:hypothetical protein
MTNQDFFQIGLPKWTGLLVTGDPVTEDQAKEILIRTCCLYEHTNDREMRKFFYNQFFGQDTEPDYFTQYNLIEVAKEEYRLLELTSLTNSRIFPSWIGGPKGWCNWDGTIGCSNYNIGKYPCVENVYDDWVLIAEAFPFLNLRCQLLSDEIPDSEYSLEIPRPVIEFVVSKGKVTMLLPEPKFICQPTPFSCIDFSDLFKTPNFERRCTIPQFIEAVEYVKSLKSLV